MNSRKVSRRSFLQMAGVGASAAFLAACAAPGADSGDGAPAADQTEVSMGLTWGASFQPRQGEFNDMFMERNPDISLEVIYNTWADHNNVVPTWAAADELPDVIYVHGSRGFPWAFEGISTPLDSYTEADEAFDVGGIWEEAMRLYRFKGSTYAIPYDHGPILLGYNKDLFDEAGMAYPDETWTMETLRENALKLTNLEAEIPQWGYTGECPEFVGTGGPSTLAGWGAGILNDDENQLTIDTDGAREAIKFWIDLIHTDKSAPTPAESEAFEQGPWIGGRIAMANVPSWETPQLAEFAPFGWDVAPWPEGPVTRKTGSFGSGFCITNDSKSPDHAWRFMSEYLSVEGMSFVWGESGRGSPAREAAYGSWMGSELAPEHAQFYLEALGDYAETSRPYQTLGAAELNDIVNRQVDLLKSGEADVDSALAAIMEEGQPVVTEAWDRLQSS